MNDGAVSAADSHALDQVFSALADPIRRAILIRLEAGECQVSELAQPFDISLQAVSKHIQVLVRAGLVVQERSGRVARCRLDAGPIYRAAIWINRYSKYWQTQFDSLAAWLEQLDDKQSAIDSGKSARKRPMARIGERAELGTRSVRRKGATSCVTRKPRKK